MELMFSLDTPLLKDIGLSLAAILFFALLILVIALILRINKKKKNPNYSRMEDKSIQLFVLFSIFLIMFFAATVNDILYYIDYTNNDTVVVYAMVGKVDRGGRGVSYVPTDIDSYKIYGLDYRSDNYEELCNTIDYNYSREYCEIEYYRTSKYLIRIKIID